MRVRRVHGARRSAHADERGSAVIELAIVALFLFTLAAGAFDYGSAWRSSLAVNEAARTGARVGSAQGTLRAADFNALSGTKSALVSSGRLNQVTRVVVYKSTSADGKVPAACKTGSTSDCQTITGAQFQTNWQAQTVANATDSKGCLLIATTKNWCPLDRDNVQASAEYYGIWIQMRHSFNFPIVGAGQTIERSTTMRLEPKVE